MPKNQLTGKHAGFIITDEVAEYDWLPIKAGTFTTVVSSGKFAPVAPYHIYRSFLSHGYIPRTVLLLAHDVVKHKKEYEETFNDPRFADTTIIMDNSLVELGKAVDTDMVYEAAEAVTADIVVLPDVMGEGIETFKATEAVYNDWLWKFKDYKLMPLIHGKNIQEWFYCAEMLQKHCPTEWIGIPRKAEGIKDSNTGKVYSRSDLIKFAHMVMGDINMHLFGFSDSIWEDMMAAKHPMVKSIDSAVPLRLETLEVLSEDAGPRGNWWDTCEFNPEMIDRCNKIDELISKTVRF